MLKIKDLAFVYGVFMMKCPNCGKPTIWKDNLFRPFCSERCKLIDFGNWADENYAMPAENAPTSAETIEQPRLVADEEDERYS